MVLLLRQLSDSFQNPQSLPPAFWLFAAFFLIWWLLALILQGEGLDVDILKRRHPHWEWLMSHPIRPVTAFSAEFLSPMMANLFYYTAPAFWFILFNALWPTPVAIAMCLAVGFMLAIAASCLNKSLEVTAMLRLPARNRGLLIGLMSFAGFIALMAPPFIMRERSFKTTLLEFCVSLGDVKPLQFLSRAMTTGGSDTPNALHSVLASGVLALSLVLCAIAITWWATRAGLQATESGSISQSTQSNSLTTRWIKNPYYRKEILWLARDKAAVVQMFLIPISLVAFQLINLQSLTTAAFGQWNTLCALAILCGTYFLIIIGPRSLSSEGAALWISQTWPRSLDSLLKAKARLWFAFSAVAVYSILLTSIVLFPEQTWKILLIAVGWTLFSWGLALKTVCLVTVPSSSGEPEKPSDAKRWVLWFGTLTFGIGVMSQSWHVATIGVVFSLITAAAMWQHLRARLPYLYDPWSEQLPRAPSLMQAMIGIAIMVEAVGVVTIIATTRGSAEQLWLTRAVVYAVVGLPRGI